MDKTITEFGVIGELHGEPILQGRHKIWELLKI